MLNSVWLYIIVKKMKAISPIFLLGKSPLYIYIGMSDNNKWMNNFAHLICFI